LLLEAGCLGEGSVENVGAIVETAVAAAENPVVTATLASAG
jgi:hypothetical protein